MNTWQHMADGHSTVDARATLPAAPRYATFVDTTHRDATSDVPAHRPSGDDVEHLAALLALRRPTAYERWAKPVFDRVVAALLLLVLSPVLGVVCLSVLFSIGRPLIFRQVRVGQGGRAFSMFKFRTMKPDRRVSCENYTGPERRVTHKSPHDPRHTPLGRLLRKTSLDELPQLVNVVRGHMSLVGPRPELADLVLDYAPWQQRRHIVKPGLTGLWQTTERGRGRLLHECVDLDLQYISSLSWRTDLRILARTPIALLRNRGVF